MLNILNSQLKEPSENQGIFISILKDSLIFRSLKTNLDGNQMESLMLQVVKI